MLREQLQSLQKAELHAHLEGTVDVRSLRILAARNSIKLNEATIFPGPFSIPAPREELLRESFLGNFHDFITLYAKITSTIQTAEDLLFVAMQYAEKASAENILGAQLYVSPTTFKYLGMKAEVLAEGLAEAEKKAFREFGVSLAWIFDIVRNTGIPGDETLEMADFCRTRGVNVCALGLGGLEKGFPGKPYRETFEKARSDGYLILIHAGETAGAESVREAMNELKADRIGHGIAAAGDPALLEELARRGTIVEVSPWSNICLQNARADTHPIKKMIEAGVQVVIAADDPGIFGKDLTDNYLFGAEAGLSFDCLKEIAARSVTTLKASTPKTA